MTPPPFRRRLLGALLLCSAVEAQALEGDRIRPSVGAVYTYTDNVYYLDERVTPNFLKGGQRSDQILGLRLGLDADHYWQRQTFTLRSTITDNRHVTYDTLDYRSYNAKATWNWVYDLRWDGDVGVERTQVASNFYDFGNNSRLSRNLRTQQAVFASGMMKMSADWKLRAAVRFADITNSQAQFTTQDTQQKTLEVGSRYYSKGTDDYLGLNFRVLDGEYPNRQVVAGSRVDNAFRQYTLEGALEYQLSGLTRLTGSAGFTTRRHSELSQRDFNGITGRLTAIHTLSSKTSVSASAFRELGTWEDSFNNYVVTQGFSITPSQQLTDKLSVQASFAYRQRSFEGDPDFVLGNAPQRKDSFQAYSLTASWLPLRQTRIDTTLSYDTRSANDAFAALAGASNFKVVTFMVSGQITF